MPERPPILWPPPALTGDTLAVAAPASPVEPDLLQAGVAFLHGAGYRVKVGQEATTPRPWGREADAARAQALEQAWLDPEIRAILGARGGYGSFKILPYLKAKSLQSRALRLVGFSDLTALLLFAVQRLGVAAFHGPTVAHLPALTPAAREDFFRWLAAPAPEARRFEGLTVLHPGTAAGPLLGGNLTTLCHLVGTPYMPCLRGSVLFLEDHNEAPYRLDRLVTHLLYARALEEVAGVVLGAFTGTGAQPAEVLEVLAQALAPLEVPVLAGLPVGHQPDNFTLPLGLQAVLDGTDGSLSLTA
ncbi:MAG: LD-carboxypeptidase [Desulfobaccales bacterium]